MGIAASEVQAYINASRARQPRGRQITAVLLGALVVPTLVYTAASILLATAIATLAGVAVYGLVWLYQAFAARFARREMAGLSTP